MKSSFTSSRKLMPLNERFREIEFSAFETALEIISPRTHGRNDSHPLESIRLRDRLCLFEQARSQSRVLRRTLFFRTHGQGLSIDVHLPDQRCLIQIGHACSTRVFS